MKSESTFANYVLSLPDREAALRQKAAELLGEADSIATVLQGFDLKRLDGLALTGNRNLDAALRLSLESGAGGRDWLEVFPQILKKLGDAEREIAARETGGIMLADFTSQDSSPLCLELTVVEVPPSTTLQITTGSGYFSNIPIAVWVPGSRLITANSNTTPMGICHPKNAGLVGVDLTRLFHPNWGTWSVPLSGIFLGKEAITRHVGAWRTFVGRKDRMSNATQVEYLRLLDKLQIAIDGHVCVV